MVEVVTGRHFTAGAVNVEKEGGYGVIVSRLTDLKDHIIHHGGADFPGNFLRNHPKKVDFCDTLFLGIVAFHQFLLKGGGRAGLGSGGEEVMALGQEEEIGDQTGSKQNQSDDE